jgi:hypothetical protein
MTRAVRMTDEHLTAIQAYGSERGVDVARNDVDSFAMSAKHAAGGTPKGRSKIVAFEHVERAKREISMFAEWIRKSGG